MRPYFFDAKMNFGQNSLNNGHYFISNDSDGVLKT
jgi:hypothetical protein